MVRKTFWEKKKALECVPVTKHLAQMGILWDFSGFLWDTEGGYDASYGKLSLRIFLEKIINAYVIPKKNSGKGLKDFRSISLIENVYKIIS